MEVDPTSSSHIAVDDSASDTTSLKSSILNYTYANGRRYAAYREGEYLLPNDEAEQDRMELLHHIWRLLLDGELLHSKPKKLDRVLDIGTGTGVWAIEFADAHPEAGVPSWVPNNCSFLVDDAEADEWTFPEKFDLIHARSLSGSFKDWPAFYKKVFASLAPGGTLEMQEHRNSTMSLDAPLTPHVATVNETINKAADLFGKRLDIAHEHKQWIEDAGFVDVVDHRIPAPVHNWPKDAKQKEIGICHLAHFNEALESYMLLLYTNVLGMPVEEVRVEIEEIKKELRNRDNHLFTDFHFISARRPEL